MRGHAWVVRVVRFVRFWLRPRTLFGAQASTLMAPVVVPMDNHLRVEEDVPPIAPRDAVVQRHVLAQQSATVLMLLGCGAFDLAVLAAV